MSTDLPDTPLPLAVAPLVVAILLLPSPEGGTVPPRDAAKPHASEAGQ